MEVVYKHAEKEKIPTKQKGNNTELERLYNMEHHDFYSLPNINRVTKSKTK
jgi:hypothetical protein